MRIAWCRVQTPAIERMKLGLLIIFKVCDLVLLDSLSVLMWLEIFVY